MFRVVVYLYTIIVYVYQVITHPSRLLTWLCATESIRKAGRNGISCRLEIQLPAMSSAVKLGSKQSSGRLKLLKSFDDKFKDVIETILLSPSRLVSLLQCRFTAVASSIALAADVVISVMELNPAQMRVTSDMKPVARNGCEGTNDAV